MKKIFIIDCYANNYLQFDVLKKCINSVKSLEVDILLVTHCPIPLDIISMVDYFIYDSHNERNEINFHTIGWYGYQNYSMQIHNSPEKKLTGHEWPIIKSITNALKFAAALNYESFIFTEYDFLFSKDDCKKLQKFYNDIETYNYEYVLFKTNVHGQDAVETIFFSGKVKEMLEMIDSYFTKTVEDYNIKFTYRWPYSLEIFFKEMIDLNVHKNGNLTPISIYEFFDSNDKNIFSGGVSCDLVYEEMKNEYYLYTLNSDKIPYDVTIFQNDVEIHKVSIYKNDIPIKKLSLGNDDKILLLVKSLEQRLCKTIEMVIDDSLKSVCKTNKLIFNDYL